MAEGGGPGGKEVGRVSVRAVPDTSGFKERLFSFLKKVEQTAKIKVGIEVDDRPLKNLPRSIPPLSPKVKPDTTPANREFAVLKKKLDGLFGRIAVDADPSQALAEFDRLAARARELDPTVQVDASTERALAKARALVATINAQKATVEVKVDTDRGLGGGGKGLAAFGGLTGIVGSLLSTGSKLPGLLGSIGGAFGGAAGKGLAFGGMISDAVGQVGGFAGTLGKVAGPIGIAVAGTIGLGAAVLGMAAKLAAGLVVLGALTFAVGALGAALGALPSLIAGLGAIGATVAIGMDGIKKAAESIKPQFEALKKGVSEVFETGLTPVLQNIANKLFPVLSTEMKKSALQLVDLADGLGKFITSSQGLELVRTAFAGARTMLEAMLPGLKQLGVGFASLISQTPLFKLLGETIGGIAGRVGDLFRRMAESGLAQRAMTQLRDVVLTLVDVFTLVIEKATQFFEKAGPGVRQLFEGIGEVIKNIDFESLGDSFGRFASTVGDLLKKIPPETWQRITDSVGRLALKFQEIASDPLVQDIFVGIIESIPLLIDGLTRALGVGRALLNNFANVFAGVKIAALTMSQGVLSALLQVAGGVSTVLQVLPGVPQSFKDAALGAVTALGGMKEGVGRELDETTRALHDRNNQFGEAGKGLGDAAANGARNGASPMPVYMGKAGTDAASELRGQGQNLSGAGRGIGQAATSGAKAGAAPIPGNFRGTAAEGASATRGQSGGFSSAGSALAAGLAGGIAGGRSSVIGAAVRIAVAAFQAAKNFLGINSPSRLFRNQIGARIGQGWLLGITDMGPRVIGAARGLAQDVAQAAVRGTRTTYQPVGVAMGQGIAAGLRQARPQITAALVVPDLRVPAVAVAAETAKVMRAVEASAAIGVESSGAGGTASNLPPTAAEIGEATASALAARGLRLETEHGEVVARLAEAGARRLGRRGAHA